ncbi:uncharacterized protein TNCV_687081 [Trichonephila clavipes]|nr:uncharacterized protein TNCV_687081 [Trichonephila clavipes]
MVQLSPTKVIRAKGEEGKCTKKYPKGLLKDTKTNDKGYPLYRRRAPEDGCHTLAQKTRGGIQEILVDKIAGLSHILLFSLKFLIAI